MNTQKCQSQQMGVSTSEYMKVTGHGQLIIIRHCVFTSAPCVY